MAGRVRRAGKPDKLVLFRHRRQALHEQLRFAAIKTAYDERGNQISESFFGPDEKPC